ncbi:peptidylprolyl isomerase [Bacteroidia bacterium]|nr:peptidylprolyl isomerase [Bacteroidia bacterium]
MKHLFLLLFIAFAGSVFAQDNIIDEVIWLVGDEAILRSDVENMRLQMQERRQPIEGDPYCVIPEQMAIQKLYLHQAKLDSIEVSDSQIFPRVEAELNYRINMAGSKEKLEEYSKKTVNVWREELRQIFREQYTVQQMQQKLVGDIKVSPADVRTFYNRIPKDSLPFIPTTVEVQIITREPVIAIEEIDDIKNRLRDYTEQVASGKREFSTLARLYSEDKGSAMRGGELGLLGKAELVPEFSAVAFELNDPKKVSRIVESEYGYHIIQLVEKRGDRINVRHILLKPQVSREEINQALVKLDSTRTEILDKKYSFEEATIYISSDKDTRNNKGLMVNHGREGQEESQNIGTSRFEMQELPIEVSQAVAGLKVDEISKPFTMINSKQKEVIAIVKLKSRTEGHKALLSEDFQILKSMVEQEKREQVLEKWLAKKQKDTYIRINDNWKNCDFQSKGWVVE